MLTVRAISTGSKNGNCYLVADGECRLLLDAGIPLSRIQEALGYRLGALSGVLVSHRHGDHSLSASALARRGVPVYGPADVANRCQGVRALAELGTATLGALAVTAFPVSHDADVPCFGYLIDAPCGDRLVYITDATRCAYTFPDVTHLMIECNHDHGRLVDNMMAGRIAYPVGRRIWRSHMSVDTTEKIVRELDNPRLREVWLIHMSDANSDEAVMRQRVNAATMANVFVC